MPRHGSPANSVKTRKGPVTEVGYGPLTCCAPEGTRTPRLRDGCFWAPRCAPLAQLIRGGHGGEVRLKLYMTMTMFATRAPHDIKNVPGRFWASALRLADPETNGARRIADGLNSLEAAKLIRLARHPGLPPTVTLLHPTGSGKAYSWRGKWWINIPVGFWTNGWICQLSAGAVALLFVTRDMRSDRKENQPHPWLSGFDRISDDTWTRARAELEGLGLLTVSRIPQGRDFDYRRMRNTYWLHVERLDDPVPTGV